MTDVLSSRRAFLASSAATLSGLSVAMPGFAQTDYPKGPITLIVPFAAGGSTDVASRLIAKKLGERIARPVIVENIGGGGGAVGALRVARSAPDGATLLMGTVATHAINPLIATTATYDPLRDFSAISLVATIPNVLVVNKDVKATNLRELIALAKVASPPMSYGSSGVGTPPHLSGELFKSMAGIDLTHVPYRGGGPAMGDLVGGHIPILFDVLSGSASHIKAGSCRAIAVTTSQRSPSFPTIPTMAESGLPGYETYTWNAVFGPAGMPRPMIEALSRELQRSVADPELQDRLKELSAIPVGSTPEALTAQVKSELAKWAPVIKSIGGLNKE